MTYTTTGIAVAVALVLVAAFFLFPGYLPFTSPATAPSTTPALTDTSTNTNQQSTTTMPPTPADPTKLQVTDTVVGTGAMLVPGATVQIKYTGMLTNGTVFDSSDAHGGTPLTLIVGADGTLRTADGNGLIPGWSQGVVGMKAGGKRTLYIPPALGYGSQAVGNIIPANSPLIFELELVSVTPGK